MHSRRTSILHRAALIAVTTAAVFALSASLSLAFEQESGRKSNVEDQGKRHSQLGNKATLTMDPFQVVIARYNQPSQEIGAGIGSVSFMLPNLDDRTVSDKASIDSGGERNTDESEVSMLTSNPSALKTFPSDVKRRVDVSVDELKVWTVDEKLLSNDAIASRLARPIPVVLVDDSSGKLPIILNTPNSRSVLKESTLVIALSGKAKDISHLNDGSPSTGKHVRVIYLVSSDRSEVPEYTIALEHAIRDLQIWYSNELGGVTFQLHSPVVEVVRSPRPAEWFYKNPAGPDKDSWGFNNTLAEAASLVGAKHNDPENIWVIYSDGPGNQGRGGSGVACLPEDDLLGLVGKHPEQPDRLRWIAGLGHELGHAFGLPHPTDTVTFEDAIMWTGIYGKYPSRTYLTPDDKTLLMRSTFFFQPDGISVSSLGQKLAVYSYERGHFERRDHLGTIVWLEKSREQGMEFHFDEIESANGVYKIRDKSRGFDIEIPHEDGMSRISADGGRNWQDLYRVRLE